MHEVSVIEEIIQTVLDETKNYPGSKVESVTLKIGKLRQFVPEIMQFCYEVATQDTHLNQSKLILQEIPIQVFCKRCEMTAEVDDFEFICPECQSTDIQMITGNELILQSIQLMDNKDKPHPYPFSHKKNGDPK